MQLLCLVAVLYLNLKDSGIWNVNADQQAISSSGKMEDEFKMEKAAHTTVTMTGEVGSYESPPAPLSPEDLPKLVRRKTQREHGGVQTIRSVHITFCQS